MPNAPGSDQLLSTFFEYFMRIETLAPEKQVEQLYNSIDDKKWLEAVLSKYPFSISRPKADQPNVASFKYSMPASLIVAAFVAVIHIELDAPSIGKIFTGKRLRTFWQPCRQIMGHSIL
jgi:hypothetical protein